MKKNGLKSKLVIIVERIKKTILPVWLFFQLPAACLFFYNKESEWYLYIGGVAALFAAVYLILAFIGELICLNDVAD